MIGCKLWAAAALNATMCTSILWDLKHGECNSCCKPTGEHWCCLFPACAKQYKQLQLLPAIDDYRQTLSHGTSAYLFGNNKGIIFALEHVLVSFGPAGCSCCCCQCPARENTSLLSTLPFSLEPLQLEFNQQPKQCNMSSGSSAGLAACRLCILCTWHVRVAHA